MKPKELNNLINTVRWSLKVTTYEWSSDIIKHVEKTNKIKIISGIELTNAIDTLKKFDINLLWNRDFWGLKSTDSICGVVTETYEFLKKLKNETK